MEIYPINTKVNITGTDLSAIVDEVIIIENGIRYNVSWWDKNQKQSAWIKEHEFSLLEEQDKITIGFKKVQL